MVTRIPRVVAWWARVHGLCLLFAMSRWAWSWPPSYLPEGGWANGHAPCPSLYERKASVVMIILTFLATASALPFLAQLLEARRASVHDLCPSLDDTSMGCVQGSPHPFPAGTCENGSAPCPTLLEAWLSVAMVAPTPGHEFRIVAKLILIQILEARWGGVRDLHPSSS